MKKLRENGRYNDFTKVRVSQMLFMELHAWIRKGFTATLHSHSLKLPLNSMTIQ